MPIETRIAVTKPQNPPAGVARFQSMPRITVPKSGTMKKKTSTCRNSRMFENQNSV